MADTAKKTIGMTCALLVLAVSAGFAQEIPLSLEEAVAIGLRDNLEVRLSAQDVEKAKLQIKEAQAAFFPGLTFVGGWDDTRSLYEKDITEATTNISLVQYLYTGGKTKNTILANRYAMAIAAAVLDRTKAEMVLRVKEAYYTLLLSEEYARLNKRILGNSRRHMQFIEARFKNGQASASDVLALREALRTVNEAYQISLHQADAAQNLLKNILSIDEKVRIILRGDFSVKEESLAFDEAFLAAMAKRPEIRQYEANEKQKEKSIEIAKAGARPRIYASWDYYSSSTSILTFAPKRGWHDYNVVGITFAWPIFDGWETKAKVEQAIVDLREARLLKEKNIRDIALEVKRVYLDLKDAIEKIKSARVEKELYKDRFAVRRKEFDAGIASSLDLDDASLAYRLAVFKGSQAAYDYRIAKSNFDKATGGM